MGQTGQKMDGENPLIDDILILAGDIGNPNKSSYWTFLMTVSKYFKHVFVVTGNHEYYQKAKWTTGPRSSWRGLSMEEVDNIIYESSSLLSNVHFLNRTSFVYERVRFIGCTLWTQSDPNLCHHMNDYTMIPGMTSDRCNQLHERDRDWLKSQLELSDPSQYDETVVVTHHPPSFELINNRRVDTSLNCFYASHSDDLVQKADIWCCGHNHIPIQTQIGGCECYINPVGYSNQMTGWNPDLRIRMEASSFISSAD
jgi:predicted phosphodiesterase